MVGPGVCVGFLDLCLRGRRAEMFGVLGKVGGRRRRRSWKRTGKSYIWHCWGDAVRSFGSASYFHRFGTMGYAAGEGTLEDLWTETVVEQRV